jgi:hypothetical protein
MSENGAIRGLTIDFNLSEAYPLEFPLLPERGRDIDFEDPGGMLFQPIATEKPSSGHIQHPIDDPEPIGGKEAQQRGGIVGTESQRPHRFENPMDFAKAERSFRFRIDAVNPVEGKKNIVKALIRKQKVTGIHNSEINAMDKLSGFLYHLRHEVNACNGVPHSREKKACSPATAADVEHPTGNIKMRFEDPFLHREKIKFAVLLQSLLTRKGFFVPQFLLGEIHQSSFPDLEITFILQNFFKIHKRFVGIARRCATPQPLTCGKTALRSWRKTLDT